MFQRTTESKQTDKSFTPLLHYNEEENQPSPVFNQSTLNKESHLIPVVKEVPALLSIHELLQRQQACPLLISKTSDFQTEQASVESSPGSLNGAQRILADDNNFLNKRKRKADPSSWKCNERRNLRMKSKEYTTRKDGTEAEKSQLKRPARRMGGRCQLNIEAKGSFHCFKISEDHRSECFQIFWEDTEWGEKKVYIKSLCEVSKAKHQENGKRSTTIQYFISNEDNIRVRVCRSFFLSTFSLKKAMVENWCKNMKLGGPLRRISPLQRTSFTMQLTQEFLVNLPKQESHYCRQSTSKLYLEPIFTNFSTLYNVYKNHCSEHSNATVSVTSFKSVFDNLNLSLFQPKKDLCNTCELFKVDGITQEEYKSHIMKKERARVEKSFDKDLCSGGYMHAITVDLQSVKQAPIFQANCIYFKSKLNVYNYTIFHLGTHDVKCYYWNETEAGLYASSFASFLLDYLSSFSDHLPITIYSDGCGYQNRNVCLSNALLNIAMKSKKIIIQKYLEKGHTQMECDSVHSFLERKTKNVNIRLPSDYSEICKLARKGDGTLKPYEVNVIQLDFVKDFASKELQRYASIRRGKKSGDPEVRDIRALKYDPTGVILYKLNFDAEWAPLPSKPKALPISDTLNCLYDSPIKLNERKWKDLQDLKEFLPKDCRDFYTNLPH